ncbi:MAG: AAA family ATPase [Oscillospiraceae bacterium]
MSEFSQEAITAITANMDDIKRRLFLNTEGDSPKDSDGDGAILRKELEKVRISGGKNIILYGVPGSGKSWTIEHEYCSKDCVTRRLVFHPDYTNADFIGQILPVVDEDKQVTYDFTPGPFTTIIKDAYQKPEREYVLIIEEVNRGNAPAIFGEAFQLLDRTVVPKTVGDITYPIGTSEYGITNENMAKKIYGDPDQEVRLPSNLSIIGTMNTSDQNVFTLDTAFQRRWRMRLIENNFDNVRASLADAQILDTGVTWKTFCEKINNLIVGNKTKMASAEDKRLGVNFVHESELVFDDRALPSEGYSSLLNEYNALLRLEADNSITAEQAERLAVIREALMTNRMFPEKVIKYLWDDAFKFNPEALFDTDNMKSLEQVIRTFVYSRGRERFKIFKSAVRSSFYPDAQS